MPTLVLFMVKTSTDERYTIGKVYSSFGLKLADKLEASNHQLPRYTFFNSTPSIFSSKRYSKKCFDFLWSIL